MATNDQKTPLGLSLNRWARGKVADHLQTTGQSLPCHVTAVKGSIVTVAFDVQAVSGQVPITLPSVTIPIVGSEYIRLPIQKGCKGMTVAADAYLGGVSGIGGGVASNVAPPNLTPLAFLPLGNVAFSVVDGNVLTLYGVQGLTLEASNQANAPSVAITPTTITLTVSSSTIVMNASSIVLSAGGSVITINAAGLTLTGGSLNFNGIAFGTHEHTGVQSGTSKTGGPTGP